jgi:uncharacterized membrane protein/DNA-binding MarR family transcriptional regulator
LAQESGLSIEKLRQPLGLSQSATVRLVDSLVADGLARRSPGPDGRTISVHLTRAGRSRARSVLVGRADPWSALADLSQTERDALTGLLEKVLAGLTTDRTHADQICRLCDYSTCPQQDCPVEQAACAAAKTGSTAGLAQPPTGGRRNDRAVARGCRQRCLGVSASSPVSAPSLAVALVPLLSQVAGLAPAGVLTAEAADLGGVRCPASAAGARGAGGCRGRGGVTVYVAMSRGGIALVAPVSAISATLSTAVGLITGERLTTQAAIGVILALTGTLAAASPPRPSTGMGVVGAKARARTYDRTAMLAAAGSALCTSAFFILIRMASTGSDPMTATLVNRLSACALVTAWALGRWPELREVRRARPLALLAIGLVGVADAVAELCYAAASTRAPLSLVAPLSSLYPAVAVMLAVTLLRERPDRIGTIGVVSALAGTALLAGA